MGNAAIYLHPNAFDTSSDRLLGRHSAGESFLRGLVRHAKVDQFHFWNVANAGRADLDRLVQRIEPPDRPVRWIGPTGRSDLQDPGVLYLPTPAMPAEAWQRLQHGSRRYAISGVTHTTASANVMGILPNFLIAPLEDYDALICTSSAVRASVDTQIDLMREYMSRQYGPRRRPEAQRVTIPLGVNCDDFTTTPDARKAWRERLDIPEDAIVALYVGRFNAKAKMNPALMAVALQRAAVSTGKTIYWVNSGWAETTAAGEVFHAETRKLCPAVEYREVDGRGPDVRFSIWSVADFFISFSDNIQESFGLTPIEAMAAGLPSVVSDWDGYKDTVRDGLDGFRVPTLAARPGFGGDLSYYYSNNWLTYDNYIGAVGQYTAVDMAKAEAAIVAMVSDAALRARMGAEAKAQARRVFDWSVIVPQYQALWAEQNGRRLAAGAAASENNPFAPDPFSLFAGYPTRHIGREAVVRLVPGMTWPLAQARLAGALASYSQFNRPTDAELQLVLDHLTASGPATVAALRELVAVPRRNYLERGLVWLARHDVVEIDPGA
ncbi:MAG: glycosyltransferase family 4 protein [Alphaproteobacteria bacterium]|nr:glycosyltransferase family 4 protein [Alphaproteobacteria bacterium]MBU1514479.1 glycosyltransferase family 4 protein [Alphaproteobacteria bacterium]MBU2096889.1 glycosyltransferase family 4 protein [Alphaproteobacteria bacterium]MBU2153516.1 glycosyltransferase family 4 protein [Alphaproteobacteria bacterium]MBU2305979.1 glycosyltransferase family 4 protein [Alphaproteobacteria bacterium]